MFQRMSENNRKRIRLLMPLAAVLSTAAMAAVVLGSSSRIIDPLPPQIVASALESGVPRALAAQDDPPAHIGGVWLPPKDWPLIAIHSALLPDGRVATYGSNADGQQSGSLIYDIWDPKAESLDRGHLTLPNITNTDLFCSAQTLLPGSGELFMAGGDQYVGGRTINRGNDSSVLLSASDNVMRPGNNMNRPRWYASVTTMADARTFIMGGLDGNDLPEVRTTDGRFQLLPDTPTAQFDYWYPRNFLGIDNRLFGFDTEGKMYWIDADDRGHLQRLGDIDIDFMGRGSTAVMYAPGQILQIGGNSNRVARLSINQPVPQPRETAATSTARFWGTSTVLPDGKVLVTGGSIADNSLIEVNNSAEMWDPASGQWTRGATGTLPRLYHSTALLLPDASVLVAGGGSPGPLVNTNAERYLPPYLFDAQGNPAARPRINAATRVLDPGEELLIGMADASTISKVVLIRAGSVTHSFNFDQRRIVLAHEQHGADIAAKIPGNGAAVPPGYYLLFAINGEGVPSEAKIISITDAGTVAVGAEWTGTIGGPGGGPFRVECRNDEVLVGVHGNAGNFVTRIGPQCVRVDAAGRWLGQPVDRDVAGAGNGATYRRTCPPNHGVVGLSGRAGWWLDQVQLSCAALLSDHHATVEVSSLAPVGGQGGGQQPIRECAFSGVARALYGKAGGVIDSLGLLCRSPDPVAEYPYFQTSTTAIRGGTAGVPFALSCHSDEVLVGIDGRAGSYVDQVSPLGVKVDMEGRWISEVVARGSRGGAGGSGFRQLCEEGQAVGGLATRSGVYVDQLQAICKPLRSAGEVVGDGRTMRAAGGAGGGNDTAVCERNRPAHGLIGRSGGWVVNALGLACRGQP